MTEILTQILLAIVIVFLLVYVLKTSDHIDKLEQVRKECVNLSEEERANFETLCLNFCKVEELSRVR